MADDGDVLTDLDPILAAEDLSQSPWVDGEFRPNMDLLRRLLQVPISGEKADVQESGRVAKALDAWVAHELRRSGFPSGAVWPRATRPRTMPADLDPVVAAVEKAHERLSEFEERLGRYAEKAAQKGTTHSPPSLYQVRPAIEAIRSSLPGSANAEILGRFYVKQVDVAISSWQRGPDVLVSGKTQFSSYLNNKNNRYEEAVGEGKNLRDRHPLAAMGFAYLVRSNIFDEKGAFEYLKNQLARLRKPDGFFDATMILALDWDDESLTLEPVSDPTEDLTASRFFEDLISAVLDYTPVGVHAEVRYLKQGPPPGGVPDPDEGVAPEEAAAFDAAD